MYSIVSLSSGFSHIASSDKKLRLHYTVMRRCRTMKCACLNRLRDLVISWMTVPIKRGHVLDRYNSHEDCIRNVWCWSAGNLHYTSEHFNLCYRRTFCPVTAFSIFVGICACVCVYYGRCTLFSGVFLKIHYSI